MSTVNDFTANSLFWQSIASNQRGFELVNMQGDLLAELVYPKRRSSAAVASTQEAQWRLERTAHEFSLTHYDEHYPRIFPIQADGTTEFEIDSIVYRWQPVDAWGMQWILESDGRMLMEYQLHMGLMQTTGEMSLTAHGLHDPNLMLTAMIGWYLLVSDGGSMGKPNHLF